MKSVVEPSTAPVRRRRLPLGWAALAVLALGCKVSSLDESTTRATQNECESDSDCRGGRCGAGICQATSGEIEHLLLEIVPPMETSSNAKQQQLSSVSYLKELDKELGSGHLDLELNPIVRIDGTIRLPAPGADCDPPEGEPRANFKLRFTPSEKILGLPGTTYSTDAVPTTGSSATAPDMRFDINVPPGRYDIYVQAVDGVPGCEVNSRLFRGRRIGLDVAANEVIDEAPLELGLSEPSELVLDVLWPRNDVNLDGWTIDIVDDSTGLPISTRDTLEHPPGAETNYLNEKLLYTPVEYPPGETGPGEALELVRLSPPESVIAPTIYIPRQALELFEKGHGTINHLSDLPPVIAVDGQIVLEHDDRLPMPCAREPMEDGIDPCAVPMDVRFVSAEPRADAALSGLDQLGSGTIGYFEQTTTTAADLTFPVNLLPGTYRVIVVPELDPERPWASTETQWSVSDRNTEQHGKTVRVRPRARVEGTIRTPNRAGITGFDVTLSASLEELTPGSFASQTGAFPLIPSASLVASSADGEFAVRSDYGTFDLSIRAASETGFAWYVLPSVDVSQAVEKLDDIVVPWPRVYTGTVSSLSAGQLPGAVIRAYTYLDSDGVLAAPEDATSVVPVGQTRVDDEGSYRLLVPSRIDHP